MAESLDFESEYFRVNSAPTNKTNLGPLLCLLFLDTVGVMMDFHICPIGHIAPTVSGRGAHVLPGDIPGHRPSGHSRNVFHLWRPMAALGSLYVTTDVGGWIDGQA